jgi:hypothetical protein
LPRRIRFAFGDDLVGSHGHSENKYGEYREANGLN